MIDELILLSGDNFEIEGIGNIKQPKLKNIKLIGNDVYYTYINMLLISLEEYLYAVKCEHMISEFRKNGITKFDIFTDNVDERQLFIYILSFFIEGNVFYQDRKFIIEKIIIDKNGKEEKKYGCVNKNNYQQFLEVICEINYIKLCKQEENYASEKARKIAEKIQQAKDKRKNLSQKESYSLSDIISSVSVKSSSYNLFNIWDLTIYQLYDQFQRLNILDEFDIETMNYAYYGGERKIKTWARKLK